MSLVDTVYNSSMSELIVKAGIAPTRSKVSENLFFCSRIIRVNMVFTAYR